MSLCAICSFQLRGDRGLCAHHDGLYDEAWAMVNRVMCDFLHRRKEPELLPDDEAPLGGLGDTTRAGRRPVAPRHVR